MPTAHAQRSPSVAALLASAGHDVLGLALGAARARAHAGDDLDEARELLAYWEQRARRLPRWALLRRREARAMAARWRARVTAAEHDRYGHGVIGAVSQYALERRAPASVAYRGRRIARVAAYTVAITAITVLLMVAATVAAVVAAVLGAF